MVFWAARMLNLNLDGQYGDMLELALYNTSLAGLSRDGTQYFYDNKLESDGSHQRWDWHPCPCCTMNVARLVASIAGYFYSVAETEVAVHLYGGAEVSLPVAGGTVGLSEVSDYPWSGKIAITLDPQGTDAFTLALRIPAWAKGASVRVNGQSVPMETERGYLKLHRTWSKGDVVDLMLPMAPERIYAHPAVRQDLGRVALRRGPLVYCVEQQDITCPVAQVRLLATAALSQDWRADLLGGIMVIKAEGARVDLTAWGESLYHNHPPPQVPSHLTAVPYYIWCNRGPNPMQVWLKE